QPWLRRVVDHEKKLDARIAAEALRRTGRVVPVLELLERLQGIVRRQLRENAARLPRIGHGVIRPPRAKELEHLLLFRPGAAIVSRGLRQSAAAPIRAE